MTDAEVAIHGPPSNFWLATEGATGVGFTADLGSRQLVSYVVLRNGCETNFSW